MTYSVHFCAEQAFLSQTKAMLQQQAVEAEPETAAMCILACAAAIEATVNSLLSKTMELEGFDKKRLEEKIAYVLSHGGHPISKGTDPLQSIARLIRVRNWLAHYKDHDIGLVNSNFSWLTDAHNQLPKIDPYKELSFKQATKYYEQTRKLMQLLVINAGADKEDFEYLYTEEYRPYLVG